MGKMYTLTEDNYMEVLYRLEKICNRFKLLCKYELFELDTPKRNKRENYPNKTYEEKFSYSKFIHPTKHHLQSFFHVATRYVLKNGDLLFTLIMILQDLKVN